MITRTETRELWRGEQVAVQRFRYHASRHDWGESYAADHDAIALVRWGAYRRRSNGVEHVVDRNNGFYRRRGEEVAAANFTGELEDITLIEMAPCALESLFAEPDLPSGPFPITPQLNFRHRELLAVLDSRDDMAIEELAICLAAQAVRSKRPTYVRRGRSRTEGFQRSLVADACEVLHLRSGDVSLPDLAREVGSSPFHLSRVFRSITGNTLSAYRQRLRVNEAVNRLATGRADLAEIASEVGFSDHSHMTRTIVAHLGQAPSRLRRRLEDLMEPTETLERPASGGARR